MTSTNSSDTDNNVLTNFQPMPKRFMVWDDEATNWICVPGTERDVWDLLDLLTHKTAIMRHKFHTKIVQSTNLFDKDGNEIFEGSIVEAFTNINKISDPKLSDDEPEYGLKIVEFYDGAFRLSSKEFPHGCGILNNYAGAMAKDLKVVGHILSNPELLEGENV